MEPLAPLPPTTIAIVPDLARISPQERLAYYMAVCRSLDVNPLTRPFEYVNLNGKLQLYARKDLTDQLRAKRSISINITDITVNDTLIIAHATATTPDGRTDTDVGAVPVSSARGEQYANALMKAITKAKRRVTLSICGLGWLDETEVASVPGAQLVPFDSVSPPVVE